MVEVLAQPERLAVTGERAGDALGLDAHPLVQGLVVAEAGQPRDGQPGGPELAQRALQETRMMRKAELAPEDVGARRALAVRLPEDVIGPIGRLHPLVAGPAGARHRQAAV